MAKVEFIATTLLGVESVTMRELKNLGVEDVRAEDGRVMFSGDVNTICQTNLWIRSAERILINMGEFTATTYDQLFEGTKALAWENWITEDAEFPVKGYSLKSKLASVPDCQSIIKKAIVERLKTKYKTQWFQEKGPLYRVHFALLKDRVTLMIDTSGEGLHKRGYRETSNEAPLKETLAAAMILLTNWKPDRELIDPFCGSGTIPIEAAMIGANIAPGLGREFVSQTWTQIPKETWWEMRKQAHSRIREDIKLNIRGYDIEQEAVELSQANAEIAGVDQHIVFKRMPVVDLKPPTQNGYIICNPPYGERMGEEKQVERLYKQMGEVFKKLNTWSYYIISSHEQFEKIFGKIADKKRKLYNGMLKCNYYQYFGPKPPKI